jgi:deoxyxylulose-5-phosphate synthase
LRSDPGGPANLSIDQLQRLTDELPHETINLVLQKGGHLGSSLVVVEMTVALHATASFIVNAPGTRPQSKVSRHIG